MPVCRRPPYEGYAQVLVCGGMRPNSIPIPIGSQPCKQTVDDSSVAKDVIRCLGRNPARARAMQRRTFMNMTAGAVSALAFDPLARATEQNAKVPVAYPDPAVEI